MHRDAIMRWTLGIGALFNFSAAAVLLFPGSIGSFADLPPSGSRFYAWLLAWFIAVFGFVYTWLAHRPVIDRPLVAVAAIGKCGVFLVALASWLLGDISFMTLCPAIGDLAFSAVFAWWLVGRRVG